MVEPHLSTSDFLCLATERILLVRATRRHMMSDNTKSLWDRISLRSTSYHRLADDSQIQKNGQPLPRPNKSARWLYFFSGLAISAVLVSTGSYITFSQLATKLYEVESLTCGTTNEEAIALGCIMEPMVYGWMPAPCYFPELSTQYHPFEDRDWYTSHEYLESQKIPASDIYAAKHKHIFTRQYHGEHCLFLWRKLSMAVNHRSEWLDHKTLSLEHADHCAEVLQDHGAEWKNSSNDVVLGFYTCYRLPWR
jgi:hypothetical protein